MIDYYGHWGSYVDGIGRFARRQARTMATVVPVAVRLTPEQWVQTEALREMAGLFSVEPSQSNVSVSTIILQERLANWLHLNLGDRAWTVVYTMFERDRVDRAMVTRLREAAQVWVPCQHNARVLVEQGLSEQQLRVVPFSYDTNIRGVGEMRAHPAAVTTGKRFYTMGTWQLRKNLDSVIGAFLLAFGPQDGATLLVKTRGTREYSEAHPSPQHVLSRWINRCGLKWSAAEAARCVQVVEGNATTEEVRLMHTMNNIYVSASHGEGWDIPAFDAVLSGNRLIHVPFGGTADWAPPSAIEVPYRLGPIPTWFAKANGWPDGAKWAYSSVEALADAMRKAPPGAPVPEHMESHYGVAAVAAQMARHLQEIAA